MFRKLKKELNFALKKTDLIPAILISISLFFIFYGLFYFFYDPIHNFFPPVNKENIIYWYWGALFPEGIEYLVMLIGSFIYAFLAYFIFLNLKKLVFLKNPFFKVVFPISYIIFLVYILFTTIKPNHIISSTLLTASMGILLYFLIKIPQTKIFEKYKFLFQALSWLVILLLVLFTAGIPLISMYKYYLGPALKLLQGEKLGSFYMIYDNFTTLIFQLLMYFKLEIYQIKFALEFIFVAWLGLYYLLACKFITDLGLRVMFILALFLTRYFCMFYDPTIIPATMPTRFDLWVILLLIVSRFGLRHWITASFFSLTYLLNNVVGLFYLVVYLLILSLDFLEKMPEKNFLKFSSQVRYYFPIFSPILIFLALNFIFFGFLIAPVAYVYANLRLGFTTISNSDFFWVFFSIIPLFVYIFNLDKDRTRRKIKFLTLGFTLVSLNYFYYNSVGDNLLVVSGALLFSVFLILDTIRADFKLKKISYLIPIAAILLITFARSDNIITKFRNIGDHILTQRILPDDDYKKNIYISPNIKTIYQSQDKLMILNENDSYINYTIGLKQTGYFVPFDTRVFVDETSDYLIDQIHQGMKIIYWDDSTIKLIDQLNNSSHMQDLGLKFDYIQKSDFRELVLLKNSEADIKHYTTFTSKELSFDYPIDWNIKNSSGLIELLEPVSNFKVQITLQKLNPAEKSITIPGFLTIPTQKPKAEGLASIPSFPGSQVKIWEDSQGNTAHLIFLPKDDSVLIMTASPSNSTLMKQAENLIESLKF